MTSIGAERTLTAQELVQVANAVRTEERLTWLLGQGAAACEQPQLRSFFKHLAGRSGERLEPLAGLLQSYAAGPKGPTDASVRGGPDMGFGSGRPGAGGTL
ncbi:hypothetical protein [Paenibacillus sp.]|uniref:hypothetical protein n=1 Tax=Paenibacillus sp. TaxID=58172 RepID=UPI002D2EE780|nr:hypothetical protein [Paenibacillus sp.]HZG56133.1 hypothetical protein [Paenibacillus sp.]